MNNTKLIVEIIGDILGVIALILNIMVGIVVILLVKEKSFRLGFSFILFTITIDIIIPIVALTQEIISIVNDSNVMLNTHSCQILGVFHTLIPICSSCGVSLLTLERYFTIKQINVSNWFLWSGGLVIISISFILSVLTATYNQFQLMPSRMMCMPLPIQGTFGSVYYFVMTILLILNTSIIAYCYSGIISIMIKKPKLMSHSLNSYNKGNKNESKQELTEEEQNSIEETDKQLIDQNSRNHNLSKRVLNKAILFVVCYTICILPAIFIMVYYIIMSFLNIEFVLSYELSIIIFASICSFCIANPILLLLLHNRVSSKLMNLFMKFNCFINTK
ncbi:hypothetical protein K502DRAFT_368138 [Neoconidiobolus thromboides FSU 785]|nr:hypothetical protein K502DRAFT_368138 [Neoconidiobolus thromboides FSU 785]